ncbi:cryptochrome/photolyase family protein [Neolewinella lacunae]|uniref:Cryptochrome/photolyase family protein n=1 Tax=Neolewinella lacunae TaxID=1517758 RepID=A0A923PRS6_9BACT|nr:cryptochrome/photolyase family protein [Neolewinella lacunae]MBC6996571.1 cryptochrome/photolyase family protein [Neolewinella lacunae]MDN3634865.1 cryptochrome/photolyase family protein [Neolewinella lacunae]
MPHPTLRLILGDQLNTQHSWFQRVDAEVTYALYETWSEATYTRHHVQKVCAFFLAMRAFAEQLRAAGHQVIYRTLDESRELQLESITANLLHDAEASKAKTIGYQLPDEYRLDQELKRLSENFGGVIETADTEHFFTAREDVAKLFKGKKTYLMETFYREMRRRHNIMMEADGKTPQTGQWNYDQENRGSLPKDLEFPQAATFPHDAQDIVEMLDRNGVETIGRIADNTLNYPLTRDEAQAALADFVAHRLPHFGTYQDAMTTRLPLLFHANLSFAMNVKLIRPQEVIAAAVQAWEKRPQEITVNQVEGFVRQILGWREYMRGVYWAKMPGFAATNDLNHQAKLPTWFWTGETKMNCLSHAIGQSLDLAYAHHIQRLMITGNFALLLGVHPDEVDAWYLGIYIDAIEWVEITNTRGMSQRADGGLVATKPYCSSANYVNKMSDYCQGCHYKHQEKTGEKACPFNSLYWDFLDRHRAKFGDNFRMAFMYKTWDRYDGETKAAILERAAWVKENANSL